MEAYETISVIITWLLRSCDISPEFTVLMLIKTVYSIKLQNLVYFRD